MSETTRPHPSDLAGVIRGHIEMILAIVPHLSADACSVGYVIATVDDSGGQLTDMGWRTVDQVAHLAASSSIYLWSITGYMTPSMPGHGPLNDLQYDNAYLFSLVSAALMGLRDHPSPLHAVHGLTRLLEKMKRRCESEEIVAASSAADGWTEEETSA